METQTNTTQLARRHTCRLYKTNFHFKVEETIRGSIRANGAIAGIKDKPILEKLRNVSAKNTPVPNHVAAKLVSTPIKARTPKKLQEKNSLQRKVAEYLDVELYTEFSGTLVNSTPHF